MPSRDIVPQDNDRKNENIRSFLHQYCMLLENLTAKTINNMSSEILYDLVNSKENFETALLIESELEKIKFFREKLFSDAIKKHFNKENYFQPAFCKKAEYSGFPNYMIFEKFSVNNTYFQLDIIHYKNRTKFTFYNPPKKYDVNETSKLLEQIIGPHEFAVTNKEFSHHVSFEITLGDEIQTLKELDKSVLDYSISLFDRFNAFIVANK